MPEYPDIVIYIERLQALLAGEVWQKTRLASPFLLRTTSPPLEALQGRKVRNITRMGKRIVFGFDQNLSLVVHLMIAGRLHWEKTGAKIPPKRGLAAFDFPHGSLVFTESSPQKRASLHLVQGPQALEDLNPGGRDVFSLSPKEFHAALTAENHTIKRSLTDPRILSGIGNAYSDEILHRAKMSPVVLTSKMTLEDSTRLLDAVRAVLSEWTDRFRQEVGEGFPKKVTAFRPEMAVHGKFGESCPVCGNTVQRIRYASNETDYCPGCQTGGKLLADRGLSRLLKGDWPKTPEELEMLKNNPRT